MVMANVPKCLRNNPIFFDSIKSEAAHQRGLVLFFIIIGCVAGQGRSVHQADNPYPYSLAVALQVVGDIELVHNHPPFG